MNGIPAILMLGVLVYKFVDFLKFVRVGDKNGIVTQLIAWVAGVGAVGLAKSTVFATEIRLGNRLLADFGVFDVFFVGLVATSIFSAFYDYKSARDNTDSAATPKLVD